MKALSINSDPWVEEPRLNFQTNRKRSVVP